MVRYSGHGFALEASDVSEELAHVNTVEKKMLLFLKGDCLIFG